MKERNYGIDFLRIFSMFMVVMLHVLGQGGVLANARGVNYWVAWLLEITCYCAVNCFALISGFVMHNSNTKTSRIIELWLQTAFYTIIFTAILFIAVPDSISVKATLKAVFPISTKHYWYISAYFGLYLLIPLINMALKNIERKYLEFILLAAFFFYSVFPTFVVSDPYLINGGYSLIWLALLYICGAYISKYDIIHIVKKRTALIVFVASVFVTVLSKFLLESISPSFFNKLFTNNFLIDYTSPTIVLSGISLFVFCAKITFPKSIVKCISLLAPASLGVYLIHNCAPVWSKIIKGFSAGFVQYNFLIMALLVLLSAFAIYFICSLIELGRIKLFKLLNISNLCSKIENVLIGKFDKIKHGV